MSQYNIKSLDYMTSGTRRGLLSFTTELTHKVGKPINLLDRTFDNGKELTASEFGLIEGQGIITESGKFSEIKTDYITATLSERNISAVSENIDDTILVATENQTCIDIDSLSGSYSYGLKPTDTSSLRANPPNAIRLILEQELSTKEYYESESKYDNYNQSHANKRYVFEYEKEESLNEKTIFGEIDTARRIFPLNDIKDVSVKSRFKKGTDINMIQANPNIPSNVGQSKYESSQNKNIDLYFTFDDVPIDVCQYGNYAFVLSKPKSNTPYYLTTNINELGKSDDSRINYTHYLKNDDIINYLYRGTNDYYPTDTYAEFLKKAPNYRTDEELIKVFTPEYAIHGIEHNYILNIDQTGEKYLENPTNYDDGNIFGQFQLTKNMYNSTYSVEMISTDRIKNCREYCGVGVAGEDLYLKYYDNVDYEIDINCKIPSDTITDIESTKHKKEKYPYQKVETYRMTQSSDQIKHKSNLFSIKISDTGLTNAEDDVQKELYANIMQDIRNNIKTLVQSTAPANTQLFDTEFTS